MMTRMDPDGSSIGTVAAKFTCTACGQEAETVSLLPRGAAGNYCSGDAIRYDFGSETRVLAAEEAARVKPALLRADAAALYVVHVRWLACYCPRCGACYCRRHWKIAQRPDPTRDGYSMHCDTFGTCPAGHRRLMAKDGMGWPEDDRTQGPLIIHGK